ncbi:MAG: hypothetical protein ACRD2L_19055 [Terriglobia bacterium]
MNEVEETVSEAERQEWLRWLVEDSLVLGSEEKVALLGKLEHLSEDDQRQLLEILLDEQRMLDRLRHRAFDGEELL